MADLVMLHPFEDCAAAHVTGTQPFQMSTQVRFDLRFGLCNEPKTRPVAQSTSRNTDDEGSQVPERVEHTGARTQFAQPRFAPSQMIRFFSGRLLHGSFDGFVARREGLTLIKRLCSNLAGMVDPHQPARLNPRRLRQRIGRGARNPLGGPSGDC